MEWFMENWPLVLTGVLGDICRGTWSVRTDMVSGGRYSSGCTYPHHSPDLPSVFQLLLRFQIYHGV